MYYETFPLHLYYVFMKTWQKKEVTRFLSIYLNYHVMYTFFTLKNKSFTITEITRRIFQFSTVFTYIHGLTHDTHSATFLFCLYGRNASIYSKLTSRVVHWILKRFVKHCHKTSQLLTFLSSDLLSTEHWWHRTPCSWHCMFLPLHIWFNSAEMKNETHWINLYSSMKYRKKSTKTSLFPYSTEHHKASNFMAYKSICCDQWHSFDNDA